MDTRLFARWMFRYTDTALGAYRMTLRAGVDGQGRTLGTYTGNALQPTTTQHADRATLTAQAHAAGYTIMQED